MSKPIVLFLCQHNAGRSQLGAALLEHIAGDRFDARSAGISPDASVNDAVAASLAELGIDISQNTPRAVTAADLEEADIVIAMKPGLALPAKPAGEHLEWQFPNPASWSTEDVRPLREEVATRIQQFVETGA